MTRHQPELLIGDSSVKDVVNPRQYDRFIVFCRRKDPTEVELACEINNQRVGALRPSMAYL